MLSDPPPMHGNYCHPWIGEPPPPTCPAPRPSKFLPGTPRPPVPTDTCQRSANTPGKLPSATPHAPSGTPTSGQPGIHAQGKGGQAALKTLSVNSAIFSPAMPSSNGSSHCSQDSGLSVSWSPRCSSPPSESQVQRHMDDMRSFLESDPIRKLEEPLAGETARPSGEAQAMKDCTSSLPNIVGFSPALNDNACLPDMDMDSASTVADDNETHSLSDLYNDITFSEDTSTGDLDQPKASGVLGGSFQDYLMPFPKDQDRRCSMDLSDSSLSPIVGRDLAMTYSDSGFCDTSPGAAAHCMSFQESPFMGHDSPDTMFEFWPGFVKSANPTLGPRICPFLLTSSFRAEKLMMAVSDSGTELQPPGFRDDFNDPILYPLSSTPTLSPTSPAFPSQMIPIFSSSESASTRSLSDRGVSAIVERLIRPMCMDESLSEFRDVLQKAEMIVRRGKIPSLRDLEKVLVLELGHQPPNCTAASYLRLCTEFFRRSKTLWDCLSDDDLCLPSEQPYDRNYVWDAWHRVVGKAQMRFKIQPHELDRIVQNMRQTIDTSVTWDVSNTRGVRRTSDSASMSPLKRRPRKRPRLTADSCSFSQASPGASAAQTTGIKRMQPPPSRATPPTTNNLSRHPPSHISTGLPTETRVVSQPLSTSAWRYNEVTSQLTSEVQLRQMQEHRTPIVTQTVAMGEARRVGLAPPTPDSPATLAQSDASVSPGPHRKRNAAKPTEHSHSFACDKCSKGFRRACDLNKSNLHACAYFITGFSAEKDRDRHFTDKHDKNTPKKMCNWNCGYSSPRESNVKQHMEKAHGYNYVARNPSKRETNKNYKKKTIVKHNTHSYIRGPSPSVLFDIALPWAGEYPQFQLQHFLGSVLVRACFGWKWRSRSFRQKIQ
ncbi:hypothetical protein FN846DRAFT_1018038 [Sphaerosporella brunnea]|uniref:C2H2-type domain-containing protein n=1 Tax=Sphaerosporella brunnea TaxID=1250544 RepID=A0A5J5FBG9_9PEZI|nr:hypothetical protein FN846DRAFT_1018038 [Sphaerosporella brunnea]